MWQILDVTQCKVKGDTIVISLRFFLKRGPDLILNWIVSNLLHSYELKDITLD